MEMLLNLSYEMMSVVVAGLFILIIIIILLYISLRDKENTKKILRLESAIEDMHKEIYKIQKWIMESEKRIESAQAPKQHSDNLKELADIKSNIISLQHGLSSDRDYFEDKILVLEERLRSLGHFNAPSQQRNEKQILDLFKNGHSIDAISKELRITKSEVEFVLKLSELHNEQV